MLYVISIEPFAHRIRNDPHIRGFKAPGSLNETKISLFADDNTPIVCDYQSIRKVFLVSELYGLASGGRINLEKSKAILLGSAKRWGIPDNYCGIQWVPFSKMLGCRFGNCDIMNENWNPLIPKINKSIEQYNKRFVSMRGRAVIANACILSKLWYLGQVLPVSNVFLKEIQSIIVKFIWADKKEFLKTDTLYLRPSDGGLGLCNSILKIKSFTIMHIIHFLNDTWAPWKDLASFWLSLDLRSYQPDLFSNSRPHSLTKPKFYDNCVINFKEFIQKHPDIDYKTLTSGVVYNLLLDDLNHVPLVVRRNPSVNFNVIFRTLEDNLMSPEVRNVCYKAVHDILSVNSRLHNFHIIDNALCPSCKSHIEDLKHMFYECPVTNSLWTFIEDILLNLCNHRLKIDFALVVYGIIEVNINNKLKSLIRLIIGIAKYCIWTARCKLVYQHKPFDSDYILSFFKATLKYRILADSFRFSDAKFKSIWCIDNLLCAKSGNYVDFLL